MEITSERRTVRDDTHLQEARGPITAWLFRRLDGRPTMATLPPVDGDPLVDDDLHLALHVVLDAEYRPLSDAARRAVSGDPLVTALRTRLEEELLDAVVDDAELDGLRAHQRRAQRVGPAAAVDVMLDRFDGPSLSAHMDERGTRCQFQEFLAHRSAYQLKEADPHTMGLARLAPGRRKAAYAEIQFDEYGNGEPGASHAELFAEAMRTAGLDPTYGLQVPSLPGTTLATGNLLSVFARRPELIGALVGHLALFEMTSVVPMGRYARAAERLGFGPAVRRFFDVHVEADEHHGDLARRFLLGSGPADDDLDPADLVFGAHALLRAEDRFARHLLDSWTAGRSSFAAG